jgi:membrane fusion protein (multidrug efflux system)
MKRETFSVGLLIAIAATALTVGCKKSGGAAQGGWPTQVIVAEAKRQPVTESLSLVGNLAANESVEIKAQADGIVEGIEFDEGQRVTNGQLLVQLDESKLAPMAAQAESDFKLAEANLERATNLFSGHTISSQEYDQASANFDAMRATLDLRKQQLSDAKICAPFAGTTGARNISPGQVISRDTVLTTLVDADPVKAEFNVPEKFLSQLQVGQNVDLGVSAYPDKKFQGEVYFIAPALDEATRTALVKAKIPNSQNELKPGMFANLDLTLEVRSNAIVIPEEAVMFQGADASVFIAGTSNLAVMKPVTLGTRLPGQIEITSGLDGGEKVVTEGWQKIGPGSQLILSEATNSPSQ